MKCPQCESELLAGNAIYKLDATGKLGLRTQAAEIGDEALGRALASLAAGQTRSVIESDLRSAGTSDEVAAEFARSLTDERRRVGRKMASTGLLWCLGGAAATLISYQVARPGGHIVLWWGAVVFGAIRLFRGLSMLSPREE